jgi:hypothetical protein
MRGSIYSGSIGRDPLGVTPQMPIASRIWTALPTQLGRIALDWAGRHLLQIKWVSGPGQCLPSERKVLVILLGIYIHEEKTRPAE